MTVAVLTITHGNAGHELLATAKSMFKELPLTCRTLSVSETCNPDELLHEAKKVCASIDQGDGTLVLTDIYGSTPCNICNKLNAVANVHVISGLNLPMLIRTLNYPTLKLNQLAEKAISGGHDGIIDCNNNSSE